MLSLREKIICTGVLAIPGLPLLALAAALVWEQGSAEPRWQHSGFCPDSPTAENSLPPSDY
ncbi:MAG: hypothetical protein IJX33_10450 [Akkermansia sp.]|nr:hypothetical protein [Akkermansia sp.]MBQ8516482.1 hypothetical protein [Akkermansia sp.]